MKFVKHNNLVKKSMQKQEAVILSAEISGFQTNLK